VYPDAVRARSASRCAGQWGGQMPLCALRCPPGIGSSSPLGHEQMACGFSGKRDAHPTWLRWQPSGPGATTLAPTVTFSAAAARGRSGSWTATRGGRPGNVPACAAAQTAICWAACLPGEKPDGEPRSEHRGELRPRGGGDLRRDDDPGAHDRWVVLRDGASRPGRVLPAPCHPRPVPRAAQSKTRRPPPMSDCCPAAAGNSSAPLSRGSAYRAVRRASW
jgi:hypothetical protein